jgi:hypothetical protein
MLSIIRDHVLTALRNQGRSINSQLKQMSRTPPTNIQKDGSGEAAEFTLELTLFNAQFKKLGEELKRHIQHIESRCNSKKFLLIVFYVTFCLFSHIQFLTDCVNAYVYHRINFVQKCIRVKQQQTRDYSVMQMVFFYLYLNVIHFV